MILHKFPFRKFINKVKWPAQIKWVRLTLTLLLFASFSARSDWILDETNSSIYFVSVKNNSIVERHGFGKISGSITSAGVVAISIDLNSVDTKIPIRDERMRKLLFQTELFPTAEFSAQVSESDLRADAKSVRYREVQGNLSLHGKQVKLKSELTILKGVDSIQVFTNYPIFLSLEAFDLSIGVSALRDIAGLDDISAAIPVVLNLRFQYVSS